MTITEVLNGLDRIIRRFVLRCKTECKFRNYIVNRKYRNSFLSLKNIYKGKRCFVIGNGPSLTAADLNLLKDEYCFAANRIFYIFGKTEWRPTFYGAQDWAVIDDIMPELPKLVEQFSKTFLISDCYNQASRNLKDNVNVLFFNAKHVSAYKERLFSDQIEKYISGGGSITYSSIQIAAYMGFSEIYLLGVDHNYSTVAFNGNQMGNEDVKVNYFEGMPTTLKSTKPNTDNSTLSFIKAKEYCDMHGIKIVNATRGGKLEVFPRMQLEEILNIK